MIHGLNVFHSFPFEPATDLVGSDHGCARALRDLDHISHMIAMTMRHENKVRGDFIGIDLLREWIGRNEGIKEQCLVAGFDRKTSMAVVGKFHLDRSRWR